MKKTVGVFLCCSALCFLVLTESITAGEQGFYVLSPEQVKCIAKRVSLELKKNPAYQWG